MKSYKHVLILLFSLIGLSTFAQTSKKTLNYQAVILDPKAIDIPGASIVGQPLNKGNVCLRFSLLNVQGGLDYEETQQVTTDEYGLVNVAIGTGSQAQASNSTSIYKSFESIVWNANVKSLKVSVSYDGCNSFKQVSAQALNYTPYALYAEAVDYKNVREAPTKLSQFSNDAGFLIPKDLDPLKTDIQTNSSKIEVANKTIADNKQASDAAFLVVNQSITSLDKQVAANTTAIKENTSSITTINTKITDQQNQINDNRNQIIATNNNLNTQIGGLQGQLNTTNSTVSSLTGTAEVVSNKSTATNLGGANPSDQAYPSQRATKAYVDNAIYDAVGTGVPDATTLAAGKVKLAGDLGGTAMNPTVPALAGKENTANKSINVVNDGGSDTKYPSVKAVKAYVDQATMGTALQATVDGKADKNSPTFTGTPVLPTGTTGVTQISSDNSTKLATTAFVQAATAGIALQASVDAKADKNSPTFTGTPILPTGTTGVTQAVNDNSTKLATTAFVTSSLAAGAPDATTTATGKVQLAGDLGGTAAAPTVPGLALKANTSDVTSSLALKEDVSRKSTATDLGASSTSDILYPSQKAVKSYVDTQVAAATIADADASTKGKLQLAGDLGGNATAPTVPGLLLKAPIESPTFTGTVGGITKSMVGLANVDNTTDANKPVSTAAQTALDLKEDVSRKSTSTDLGAGNTSDVFYPSQKAVKTYVDAQIASGAPDATTTTTGKVQLAGDLGGNATAPTVPGLLLKAPIESPTFTGTVGGITKSMVGLANVDNTTDANKPVSTAAQTALNLKAPIESPTFTGTVGGITKAMVGLADVDNTTDANKPVSTAAQAALNLKAPLASPTFTGTVGGITKSMVGLGNVDNTADADKPVSTAGQTALNLKAPLASPTFTGTVTSPIYASAPQALTDAATISWNPANGLNANVTLGGNRTLSFSTAPASGSYGTLVVTQDGTGSRTLTLPSGTNKVLGSASTTTIALSSAAGAKDILNFYYDGLTSTYYWNVGQGYGTAATAATVNLATGVTGTLAVANGGTGATSASDALTALGAAPIASPTFTGTLTAPIYASVPQNLTDAATISWNPANGLNANVTLGGNRTLSFSSAPASGSYGTLVVTQDATGGKTLTLPSGTNKVLGSISTTTISLSAAANAKDILNFYFDGTTYFWNIGQGYGTASTITANNIAGGAAGSIPYQTGAGATGFLAKGTDGQILTLASGVPFWTAASATGVTSVAMSTPTGLSVSGSPITSAGTLALSLTSGYAIPLSSSQTNWDAAYTNRITSASSPLSISSNALSLGTVPVGNGGTGAITLTSGALLKGNGTSAITAATAGTDYSAGTSLLQTGILKSTTSTGALTIAAASDFPTLNQSTTGNASTATKLAASKNINGVAFDGSSDITISASAGTLSGAVAVANGGTGVTTAAANAVFAGPASGASPAAPSFRGLVAADLPSGSTNYINNTTTQQTASFNISGSGTVGTDLTLSALTASKPVFTDANNKLTSAGTLGVSQGGTGLSSTPTNGQILIGNGTGFALATLTAGTAITITNSAGAITIAAAIRPTSDEFTATAGQTAFTLSQTPLTNTTTSPVKPNVWMFINGVRTKNLAYAVSGTSVTYTASSNNSYTLVAGDRIQFDYAY